MLPSAEFSTQRRSHAGKDRLILAVFSLHRWDNQNTPNTAVSLNDGILRIDAAAIALISALMSGKKTDRLKAGPFVRMTTRRKLRIRLDDNLSKEVGPSAWSC